MSDALDWSRVGDESVALLKELLCIDTTNPPGNEKPAAELLARLFEREGIEATLLESEPGRTSVVARLKGSGKHGPLLLNGHLDVVPADPEHWQHPPFSAEEADGCIWARGAIDMKNMVAMSAMALVLLARQKVKLDRDVIFAGVADEEAGSRHGALFLVEKHPALVRSEYVLNEVGGYTLQFGATRFYPIQVSEKGICWFQIVAKGEPGHGSMPRSDNAVVRLSKAIAALGSARLPHHVTPVVETFLRRLAESVPFPRDKLLPLLLEPRLAGFLLDTLGRKNPDQARGIGAMLSNTVSPTLLEAGKKVNVIPSSATATVDGRTVPGQSVSQFLAEVQKVIGDDLTLNVMEAHEGTVFPSDTPLYSAIEDALARHDPSGVPVPFMIPGFTDSFAYARLGAICYGFSPVQLPPDLNFTRMYHGHDERIPIEGYRWGQRVLYELVRDFCREK
ncbi:MAG: M20/M25/M40 family metallo-hydrolase [Myxococcales bacterium]|nr:M20/M25/M40 family metallo-hydrolase [Myxococcales bacterium]